jgi:hypothetical protein
MALIHNARLAPSKIELLRGWLPSQSWCPGHEATAIEAVGAYRFDDPAGEVGIETHLLTMGNGQILQVPLTYRGAPLDGAEATLVGVTEHSVLGQRWVYDACADPVYADALATAILSGGTQAELLVESDGEVQRREPTTRVTGSGTPAVDIAPIHAVTSTTDATSTTITANSIELVVRRLLDGHLAVGSSETLVGTWPGQSEPVVLALARTH